MPVLSRNQVLKGEFRVGARLGEGACAEVYCCERVQGAKLSRAQKLQQSDADLVVKWEHLYDRDLAAPLGENGSSPLLLGAEAALWGEKIDHRTVDAVAWPRAAVFAARLWSPDAAFTPGNYTAAFRRLVVHRCRLVRLGVSATPVDEGAQKFDRRSPWLQCLS